ncbi:hypothetical protein MKX03_026165 [Papaver bracteatum]|nr:hypothetical protein MKX03_026165 [Papaver bracteatum]
MMASRSSQVGLLLFAMLAFSNYIEKTSAVVSCSAGENFVQTKLAWRGGFGSQCAAAQSQCTNLCAGQGRTVARGDCTIVGHLLDWYSCSACCAAPPPRPSPSPPPPSPPPPRPSLPPPSPPPPPPPPPPSPPPPSPPPPPPSPPPPSPPPPTDPRDMCSPDYTSLSTVVTDCSLCPVCNCGAGVTPAIEACFPNVNYCNCCCPTTLTSSSTVSGSSLFAAA